MPRRSSLSDRNRAAIAPEPPTESAEPTTEAQAEPKPSEAKKATGKKATARKPRQVSKSGTTARLGIYLTPAEFDNAKAAYLADWTNGGQADTFAKWIGAAIDMHADRTPKERADRAHPKGRSDERTGSTRSFNIPTDTMAKMREAITADQHAGRWPSDSAWCGEAIALAVEAARTSNGGDLPTPPQRLPNRLVR